MNKKTLLLLGFSALFFAELQAQTLTMVKEIYPGGEANVSNLNYLNGEGIFTANNGVDGLELWKTDGTEAGTFMLKDINPNGDSYIEEMKVIGNKIYFAAYDGIHGKEPWITDGTSAGTIMLKDINPMGNSAPKSFFEFEGKTYFSADDGINGPELWVSDGTEAGTNMLVNINPTTTIGYDGSHPFGFTAMGNHLYFTANDGAHGYELWKSDGTAVGTEMVKDIEPGSLNSGPRYFQVLNLKLYFVATELQTGTEMWNGCRYRTSKRYSHRSRCWFLPWQSD